MFLYYLCNRTQDKIYYRRNLISNKVEIYTFCTHLENTKWFYQQSKKFRDDEFESFKKISKNKFQNIEMSEKLITIKKINLRLDDIEIILKLQGLPPTKIINYRKERENLKSELKNILSEI